MIITCSIVTIIILNSFPLIRLTSVFFPCVMIAVKVVMVMTTTNLIKVVLMVLC